jgi:hypothetical protein
MKEAVYEILKELVESYDKRRFTPCNEVYARSTDIHALDGACEHLFNLGINHRVTKMAYDFVLAVSVSSLDQDAK